MDGSPVGESMPMLSVVVPVRNEERHIVDLLQQLMGQSLPNEAFEVVVVDGQSEDSTAALVRQFQEKYPNVHLVENRGFTSSWGRNIGVEKARGKYVLFVDGHCQILSSEMLAKVLVAFEGGEVAISRPQPLLVDGVGDFQKAVALARQSFIGHNSGSEIFEGGQRHCNPMSAGCGYELGLFRQLGGIDVNFDAAEDLEFNFRVHELGLSALHSDSFAVGYYPRANWRQLFRQIFRYGYGRARMARKHPKAFSPLAALLAVACLTAGALLVLGIFAPVFWVYLSLGLLLYFLIVVGASFLASKGQGPKIYFYILACFPAIHLGSGIGYLSGLVGGPSLSHRPK